MAPRLRGAAARSTAGCRTPATAGGCGRAWPASGSGCSAGSTAGAASGPAPPWSPRQPRLPTTSSNPVARRAGLTRLARMDGFDPATSFGPDVASRYDDEPRGDEAETVDLLAGLAGTGRALELADRDRPDRGAAGRARGTRRRHRALPRHGRAAAHQARGAGLDVWPGDMSRRGDRAALPPRLPRVQHALQPAHPGRPGAVLPQRGPAPHRRRGLRGRGGRAVGLDRRARLRPARAGRPGLRDPRRLPLRPGDPDPGGEPRDADRPRASASGRSCAGWSGRPRWT